MLVEVNRGLFLFFIKKNNNSILMIQFQWCFKNIK